MRSWRERAAGRSACRRKEDRAPSPHPGSVRRSGVSLYEGCTLANSPIRRGGLCPPASTSKEGSGRPPGSLAEPSVPPWKNDSKSATLRAP